ncbi:MULTISPECIES: TRAP transporter large permease [Phyllobacteriaceae]|uniref:TRAP transporter large permease subunit n=1 Tax=Ollibium composti TaxID=2675109 RepID=A0ABY2Q303_9HYPH|nr:MULTISPECIES: TRAP transporter large permease subunit [Mesorhizobium]QDC00769.1 TRAP transporter large permease subunit [Mesorhizobium sp. 8]THF55305.1 TRAP transporter large permease subunit [Mesorhizobium composti]
MALSLEYLPLFMFLAMAILLFSGFPVAFVLGGVGIAFAFTGILTGVLIPIQLYTITTRMWAGAAENLVLTTIPLFVFMGIMLERSGVAKDMLNSLQLVLGRVPGGLALAVTLLGIILAAATGIVGASVVMMSMLALPVMLDQRYSVRLATGTIASSGTLGILIPPSIMLIVIADLLSRSVGVMFMTAFVPGLLLGGLYLAYILLICLFRPDMAPPPKRLPGTVSWSGLAVTLAVGLVPAFVLIFLVLGSIIFGWATPTESAGVGAAGAMLLAFVIRPLIYAGLSFTRFAIPNSAATETRGGLMARLVAETRGWWPTLKDVLHQSALTTGMIFMIILCATVFALTFRLLGGEHLVTDYIKHLGLSPWHLLIIVMGLVFFLGFFFEWIEITLIVLPVFAPILLSLDFGDHVAKADVAYWFAILLAVNLQTSFLTPPMGPSLFYMKAVSPPGVRMQDIYWGIIPFVLLQIIGLGLVMAFPQIALWMPHMLLDK